MEVIANNIGQYRLRIPRRLCLWLEGRFLAAGHGLGVLCQLPNSEDAERVGDEQVQVQRGTRG